MLVNGFSCRVRDVARLFARSHETCNVTHQQLIVTSNLGY